MNAERRDAEERAAREYAEYILQLGPLEGWSAYNAVIVKRWSMSALKRVKVRAWQIVENR